MQKKHFKYWASTCFLLSVWACQSGLEGQKDWLKIPIEACVQSNEKIFEDVAEIRVYCECLIPEIYELVKADKAKVKLMRDGDLDFLKHAQEKTFFAKADKCRPENPDLRNKAPVSDFMLPHMARGIKISLRDDLIAKGMADKIDIDAFCDCIVDGIKSEFTMSEFSNKNLSKTEKYLELDKVCKAKHQKQ